MPLHTPLANLEAVDRALLPGRVAELADVIGLVGALKLVELRGGVRMTVPKREPGANHWLRTILEDEEVKRLCDYYGGETIEIDRCAAAIRRVFEQQIVREKAQGHSNSQLARKYGYTERGIRKLRARVEDRPVDSTVDLFDFLAEEQRT